MPMRKRDAERLARENGATFLRHGSRHDIWITKDGAAFQIPRHPGDFTPGVEKDIKGKLGVN